MPSDCGAAREEQSAGDKKLLTDRNFSSIEIGTSAAPRKDLSYRLVLKKLLSERNNLDSKKIDPTKIDPVGNSSSQGVSGVVISEVTNQNEKFYWNAQVDEEGTTRRIFPVRKYIVGPKNREGIKTRVRYVLYEVHEVIEDDDKNCSDEVNHAPLSHGNGNNNHPYQSTEKNVRLSQSVNTRKRENGTFPQRGQCENNNSLHSFSVAKLAPESNDERISIALRKRYRGHQEIETVHNLLVSSSMSHTKSFVNKRTKSQCLESHSSKACVTVEENNCSHDSKYFKKIVGQNRSNLLGNNKVPHKTEERMNSSYNARKVELNTIINLYSNNSKTQICSKQSTHDKPLDQKLDKVLSKASQEGVQNIISALPWHEERFSLSQKTDGSMHTKCSYNKNKAEPSITSEKIINDLRVTPGICKANGVRSVSIKNVKGNLSKQKKSPKKNKRGRPPGGVKMGMPKRPLSAYNVFFREERKRILNGLQEEKSLLKLNEVNKGHNDDGPKIGNLRPCIERNCNEKTESEMRMTFNKLGKIVGQRWRDISAEELVIYQQIAKKDQVRYQEQLNRFKEKTTKISLCSKEIE